jgi:hypothetical protein
MSPVSGQKFTTYTYGPADESPVAVLARTNITALLGSIVQLDGRKSYDPEKRPLNYYWNFRQVPIGSTVEDTGFKVLRPRSSAVSFIPDKVGNYVVELVVDDGEYASLPVTASIFIQYCQVPVGENIVPDAQFLWNYISDFWALVEDREKITTIWSGVLQLIGSELLTLWDHDLNKSLASIQPVKQRRWQRVSMRTDLTPYKDQRIIVGKTDAGTNGRTGNIGQTPGTGATSVFYVPLGQPGDGDRTDFTNLNGNFGAKGRLLCVDGVGHIIERVANKGLLLSTNNDGDTALGTNILSSVGTVELPTDFVADGVQAGDRLVIRSGENAGTYLVKSVSTTQVAVAYLTDPPGGPLPSFQAETSQSFIIGRPYSVVFLRNATLPDGVVGASWRLSHLLHVPGAQFQARGVSEGDVLVLEVTRNDVKLSAELRARVVGAAGDRLAFEFTTEDLAASTNSGAAASIVASGGVVTVSGLTGMLPTSIGGSLQILNGDNPGTYKILSFIDETSVTIRNPLASGADSGNPAISWVERNRSGMDVERDLFKQLVQDLRLVPGQASDQDVSAFAETFISFLPPGINLAQRNFGPYKFSMKAKQVIHNRATAIDKSLVSLPALQETPADPPTILLENLDYTVEEGMVRFVSGLFSPKAHSPEDFWAELALLDNSDRVEENFGRLVNLKQDDLNAKQTRAPYLSAVKGLIFSYANGPTVNNIRLGMQILLGLPFTEEKGLILEHQEDFTTNSDGDSFGRVLVEDLDNNWKLTGNRRIYFYPMAVGLEINPATGVAYTVGDTLEAFVPICKGVDVQDYVKVPDWWTRSLYGLEVLKYFVFKIVVDSAVFDSDDVQFALDFVKAIKPTYTRVIATLLHSLEDDISVEDEVGGAIRLKFYDNVTGLEATNRATDDNHQGVTLWHLNSRPYHTRVLKTVRDLATSDDGSDVLATSASGWGSLVRAEQALVGPSRIEGDLLHIHQGQPGAGVMNPVNYEIKEVVSPTVLKLLRAAPLSEPVETQGPALDVDLFEYGTGLTASVIRRQCATLLAYATLDVSASGLVTGTSALFKSNNVMPGDHLVLENQKEEYVIDGLEVGGAAASITWATSEATVTGLTGRTVDDVGKFLELTNSDHNGRFRVTGFVSATSLKVYSTFSTGADSHNGAVGWLVLPDSLEISETQLQLKRLDGTKPALSALFGVPGRVVRPRLQRAVWHNVWPNYHGGSSTFRVQITGETPSLVGDAFSPGMVGTYLSISDSPGGVNDGIFLITDYISCGVVVVDNPSVTSDPSPGVATMKLLGVP